MSCRFCWVVLLLALGSATAGEVIEEPAAKPKPVPKEVEHRTTAVPDRIILTFTGDPTTSQAVTWRTDTTVTKPIAQVAEAEAWRKFEGKAQTLTATTSPLKSDLSEALYHSVTFGGLNPETKYVYRVGDGTNWSEWAQFETASTERKPFSFVYFGDAQNEVKAHWSRVIRQAYSDMPKARFIVHAGDLINTANKDYEWGEWHYAAGWVNAMVPSVPTPGNHEYWSHPRPKSAADDKPSLNGKEGKEEEKEGEKETKAPSPPLPKFLSRHWRPQFALPEHGPPGLEETVYYLDYQGVRIVSLNSNEKFKEQVPWLEEVLADNPNRWTVLTFHHPIYSPAKKRDNKELRQTWMRVFDKYQIDLVLQGHDHTYGRSGILTAEDNVAEGASLRDRGRGTVYCVSVSGPKMYELKDDVGWMKTSAANTQLYQLITIDGDRLRYEAKTPLGEVQDVFELRKQSDSTNRLVEREQLEGEAKAGSWGPSLTYGLAAACVVLGGGLLWALRRGRAAVRAAG